MFMLCLPWFGSGWSQPVAMGVCFGFLSQSFRGHFCWFMFWLPGLFGHNVYGYFPQISDSVGFDPSRPILMGICLYFRAQLALPVRARFGGYLPWISGLFGPILSGSLFRVFDSVFKPNWSWPIGACIGGYLP